MLPRASAGRRWTGGPLPDVPSAAHAWPGYRCAAPGHGRRPGGALRPLLFPEWAGWDASCGPHRRRENSRRLEIQGHPAKITKDRSERGRRTRRESIPPDPGRRLVHPRAHNRSTRRSTPAPDCRPRRLGSTASRSTAPSASPTASNTSNQADALLSAFKDSIGTTASPMHRTFPHGLSVRAAHLGAGLHFPRRPVPHLRHRLLPIRAVLVITDGNPSTSHSATS